MKIFSTLVIVVSFIVFSAEGQNIEPAPADKAVIYFVRPSSLGFAVNFSYFDSTRLIGKFSGPAYIRYTCDPGAHIFWARSENRDFVEADVEAGRVYFIEAIVKMGAVKAAVNLDPVNPEDEKRMKKILKLIDKKPSESSSDEELKAEERKLKEVIVRGLEEYNSGKLKGKTGAGLDKSMYYKFTEAIAKDDH
jgi:hypothetical protein